MKKSVTLIELIIAISLMAVIVLGAGTFHIASEKFLRSTETKTQVLNDLAFIYEHMSKYTSLVTGDANNRGVEVDPANTWLRLRVAIDAGTGSTDNDPSDYSNDLWIQYRVDGIYFKFCSDFNKAAGTCTTEETLTSRLVAFNGNTLNFQEINNGIQVNSIALQLDPGSAKDDNSNPRVTLIDTSVMPNPTAFFFPLLHSLN